MQESVATTKDAFSKAAVNEARFQLTFHIDVGTDGEKMMAQVVQFEITRLRGNRIQERCVSSRSAQESTCVIASLNEIAGLVESVFAVRQSYSGACDMFVVGCCSTWCHATNPRAVIFGLQRRTFGIVFDGWIRLAWKRSWTCLLCAVEMTHC